MVLKWDYKTVERWFLCGEDSWLVDEEETTPPDSIIQMLKELGQEGWELVSYSTSVFPSAIQLTGVPMPMDHLTPEAFPVIDEEGYPHPAAMPSTVSWWVFKRPID